MASRVGQRDGDGDSAVTRGEPGYRHGAKKRAPRRRPIEGNESGGGGKWPIPMRDRGDCHYQRLREGDGGGEAGIIRKKLSIRAKVTSGTSTALLRYA